MQRPNNNDEMICLFGEIDARCPNISSLLNNEQDECLPRLLGKLILQYHLLPGTR